MWIVEIDINHFLKEKVFEELKEVLGDLPRKLEYSVLGKLKYMEMCIKEAMRLFAVAPFILRRTEEDFQLGKLLPELSNSNIIKCLH